MKILMIGDQFFNVFDTKAFDAEVVNCSRVGEYVQSAADYMETILPTIDAQEIDAVLINLGYNDYIYGVYNKQKTHMKKTLGNIIDMAKQIDKKTKAVPFIVSLKPAAEGMYAGSVAINARMANASIAKINEYLEHHCFKNSISYINIFKLLYNSQVGGMNPDYSKNGFKLTSEATNILADLISESVEEELMYNQKS